MFIEIKSCKKSISLRSKIHGVGINDAQYNVTNKDNGRQKMCPYYMCWRNMIIRCYSDKFQSKNSAYSECFVDVKWLTFSNFKSWMIKQDWKGKHLDKDIIKPGNKKYSEETCAFVPRWLNNLLTNSGAKDGETPRGVTWHKDCGKYASQIRIKDKNVWLGVFDSKDDAHKAYVNEKINRIISAANLTDCKSVSDGLMLHVDYLKRHWNSTQGKAASNSYLNDYNLWVK